MPKPIYATEDMIKDTFDNIRKEFEEQFAAARAGAATKKMANGNLDFKFTKFDWSWKKGVENERATLTITPEAYSKIMLTILSTDKEVGWHGTIVRDEEDDVNFILKDIFFFPQEVTGTTVVADESAYPMWAMKLPEDKFNEMRFHGHSHVNMPTLPSGTDMDYRAGLIHQFENGFYVFLIINKKMETNCQIYDFDNNMLYCNSEIDVVIGDGYAQEVADATREMVKQKSYSYGGKGKNYGGYSGASTGGGKKDSQYYGDYGDYGAYGDDYFGQPWWNRQFGNGGDSVR